jgi:hypothetical protein
VAEQAALGIVDVERGQIGQRRSAPPVRVRDQTGASVGSASWASRDAIDAVAVARAVVKDGVERFPAADLDERAMEIRRLADHREDPVRERTRKPGGAPPGCRQRRTTTSRVSVICAALRLRVRQALCLAAAEAPSAACGGSLVVVRHAHLGFSTSRRTRSMSLLFAGPCAKAVGGRSSWSGIPPAPLIVERQGDALPRCSRCVRDRRLVREVLGRLAPDPAADRVDEHTVRRPDS